MPACGYEFDLLALLAYHAQACNILYMSTLWKTYRIFLFAANINDRSMVGKRDSEIAVIVKDTEFVSSS